jgi:hypothetical protein
MRARRLLKQEWRLLCSFEAVNGIILFGSTSDLGRR